MRDLVAGMDQHVGGLSAAAQSPPYGIVASDGESGDEKMSDEQQVAKPAPVLQIAMLSHGTLECRDLDKTREFYERFSASRSCAQVVPRCGSD